MDSGCIPILSKFTNENWRYYKIGAVGYCLQKGIQTTDSPKLGFYPDNSTNKPTS